MRTEMGKVLISLLVGSLVLVTKTGLAEEKNLLENPGFEKFIAEDIGPLNEGKSVLGWMINTWACPGTVELVTEEGKAHTGSQCLIFHPETPGKKEAHIFQMVPVESSNKYLFKVYARVDKEVLAKLVYGCRIKLVVYQYKDGQFLGSVGSDYLFPVTEKWKEFTYEYTPTTKEVNRVGCAIAVIDAPVYIDDVSFSLKKE